MAKRPKRIVIVINVILVIVFTILSLILEFFPEFKLASDILMFGSVFSLVSTSVAEYFYLIADNQEKTVYKSDSTLKSMFIGILIVVGLYMLKIYDNPLFFEVQDFSKKGGLWALSTALVFLILLGNQYEDDTKKIKKEIDKEIKFMQEKKAFNEERKQYYLEKKAYLEEKKENLLKNEDESGKN